MLNIATCFFFAPPSWCCSALSVLFYPFFYFCTFIRSEPCNIFFFKALSKDVSLLCFTNCAVTWHHCMITELSVVRMSGASITPAPNKVFHPPPAVLFCSHSFFKPRKDDLLLKTWQGKDDIEVIDWGPAASSENSVDAAAVLPESVCFKE